MKKITKKEIKETVKSIKEIKKSFILIGNDSGPVNIARLLGIPTFTIFGPTNPGYHLPDDKKHKFIQGKVKCIPSESEKYCYTNAGRNGCPSFECMHSLEINTVFEKILYFCKELKGK